MPDESLHHGSESYFVLGEGLLGETLGGRSDTLSASARGGGAAVPLLADGAEGHRQAAR